MEELGSRFARTSFIVLTVSALRLAKMRYSYRELSTAIGIPSHQIARYVNGHTLPRYETAVRILEGLWKIADPRRALAERLAETGGTLDTSVVLTNPLYLLLISLYYAGRLVRLRPTRIVVPEASGIPLASTLSIVIGVPFTVARRKRPGWICSERGPVEFCIPPGSISRGDRVVIVDDILETGSTASAVEEVIEKAGGRVCAIAALVAVGDEWKLKVKASRIICMVHLRKPEMKAREPSL
jgi:adenine/guanine phosphoribosyltransferase-like PRPP-binding protein